MKMPENLEVAKRKRELEEPRNFDIIGNLFCDYGMTGANLVRDIFSYMDVSSLQGGHLVCKTWNHFLNNDRKLWMDILRQTEPYFEFLSLLSNEEFADDAKRKFSKEYFDFLEKNEDFCSQNIIKSFKRIQMIHISLQDVIQDCPVYKVFQKEFIGEKLAKEIELQIDRAVKEKQPEPQMRLDFESSFAWLLEAIASLKVRRDKENYLKEKNKDLSLQFNQDIIYQGAKNISDRMLENIKKELKVREEQLLLGIKITLHESCTDV